MIPHVGQMNVVPVHDSATTLSTEITQVIELWRFPSQLEVLVEHILGEPPAGHR